MTLSRITQAVVTACILSGCVMSQYEDVSAEPKYRSLIGRELRGDSELLLHEVTLDRNYAQRVDLCSVTSRPGFAGPEVINRRVLAAGTPFRVQRVRRCTNCLGEESVELIVSSPSVGQCGQAPIKISYGALGSSVHLVSNPANDQSQSGSARE
jgi:hypothetical protein